MADLSRIDTFIGDRRLIAHLATSTDDRPHVVPVWYAYDDGTLEVMTSGSKVERLRENPRASVSIQEDTDGRADWYVSILGTATVVDDVDRVNGAARRVFSKYLGDDETEWPEFYRDQLGGDPSLSLVAIDIGSTTTQTFD